MKKFIKSILIISTLLASSYMVLANNYYVSKSGDDNNSGSFTEPFLTLTKASSLVKAGDTCFVMEGVYRELLNPKNSGQNGNPIVFTNYLNDSVLISATTELSNIEKYEDNIYKAPATMNLGRQNMMFCNQNGMDWARWPNNTDNDKYTVQGVSVESGSGSTILSSEIDGTNWTGGYVWYLGAHSGTSWTREITKSQSGKITFTSVDITKWPFNPHNPTVLRNGNRGQFYIFNTMAALDYQNEWYYNEDTKTVYFQTPENVDPSNLIIEIAQRSQTILLEKPYIVVDGINAFGGKVEIKGTNCTLKNGYFLNCLQSTDDLTNTGAQVGDGAIHVRANHTLIENNVIDGSSLNGIYVQGWGDIANITISNNLVKNCNTTGIHASPIRSNADYTKITWNTIHTTGRDGVYCSGTFCELAYNDVYDCMRINNDGGLFYTVGNANDKNVEIHHNWFHDSTGPEYADGRCAGIYLDNHSKGFKVYRNVVWDITWTAVQINWDNWNIDIFNNSFYNIESAMGRWENGYTIDDLVVTNNYASHGEWIGTNVSTSYNRMFPNSPFYSLENHDFRPLKNSLLVNKGTQIEGITDGFIGSRPDVGAYEYGLTPWIPGRNGVVGEEVDTKVSKDSFGESELKVFPNPVNNSPLTIHTSSNNGTICIYDTNSKVIYKEAISANNTVINRNTFKNKGVYLVQIKTDEKTENKKIVVL